jgi:hypothetical protein
MKPLRLLLLACLGLGVAPSLPAQELRKPKDAFPESGMASFRLRIKSIPTLRVLVNGVPVVLGVDTGCQGTAVLTPGAAQRCGITEGFSLPTMGIRAAANRPTVSSRNCRPAKSPGATSTSRSCRSTGWTSTA